MAINKAFVVKNSLEVNQKLILADATTGRVGIGTSQPKYLLDVAGGIGVTDIYAVGVATFTGRLNVGSGGTVITALGTGLVGVGTINPVYLLDVRSPVSIGQTALYVRGDARITGDLVVEDDLILDEITTRNLNVTGVTTSVILNVTGVSTFSAGPVIIGAASSTGTASQLLQVTGGAYVSGNVGVGTTNPLSQLHITGQFQSTGTGTTTTGGGQIYLNGATSNRIDFNTNGLGAPTFTTRSSGTKILLYPLISGSTVDYAVGIDSSVFWYSIPDPSSQFRWYASNANIASLFGNGNAYISGSIGVASSVGIGTTLPQVRLDVVGNAAISGFATISALGVSGITTTRNLQVIGVSTLGTVQVSSGIVTASAGIVTYYGDGSKLTGVIASGGGTIGVRSEGSYVGGGVTTLDFKTTTGTNVAVSAPVSGVATVTIQPGVSLGLAIALGG